jgi:hypothetical protein
VDRFKAFYRNTMIADEGFFQTVIMNTSYKSTIVNDDKRAIDWIPMGTIKLRPRDFTASDAKFLMTSTDLANLMKQSMATSLAFWSLISCRR